MQIINSILTVGVAVLAIALITFAIGKVFVGLPAFAGTQGKAAEYPWNDTMANITANTRTAFGLLGISPLVLGVGLIITVIIGGFGYMYMEGR